MIGAPEIPAGTRIDAPMPGRQHQGHQSLSLHRIGVLVAACCALGFLVAGGIGLTRYVETFWLYRGFPPPPRPTFIVVGTGPHRHRIPVYRGTVTTIQIASPALGGQKDTVIVYLPPNYDRDITEHYPVLYLLHGIPGSPSQFVDVGDIAVQSEILLAEHRIEPMILVMPSGSTNFFQDNEWANSIRPNNAWETFVSHDLVDYIDQHYRAITTPQERGIGGLSEGGYGAVNIALHNVGEFDLIEGWSAYYKAENLRPVFGGQSALLVANSPEFEIRPVASELRADRAYFWLYSGTHDDTMKSNIRFAKQLQGLGIRHTYFKHYGRHTWLLWRQEMPKSLEFASHYFAQIHAPT